MGRSQKGSKISFENERLVMELQEFKNLVAERVCSLRQEIGMTQDELVKKTGFPADYIRRLEEGKISPSHKARQTLAKALDVDNLGENIECFKQPDEIRIEQAQLFANLFEKYMQCSKELQKEVHKLVELVSYNEIDDDEKLMALATIADALSL